MVLAATPLAVRDALRRLLAAAPLCGLTQQDRSTAEIVLAEVLNNIVEHGYAGRPGDIAVTLIPGPGVIRVEVADDGAPMPGGTLPEGEPHDLTGNDPLPEGGFGWYLIRVLTCGLEYRRVAGRNLLHFGLEVQQTPPWPAD
jgi:serine/threonine-protein kinase RsbW